MIGQTFETKSKDVDTMTFVRFPILFQCVKVFFLFESIDRIIIDDFVNPFCNTSIHYVLENDYDSYACAYLGCFACFSLISTPFFFSFYAHDRRLYIYTKRMAKSLVVVRRSIDLCHVVFAHNINSCISNSFPYKK